MKSGIYAKFGPQNGDGESETKDMITEATAQQFKDWLGTKGMNISFMSDDTLNGVLIDRRGPFMQWQIRCAFIADAGRKGIVIEKVKVDWDAFAAEYEKEANKHYG